MAGQSTGGHRPNDFWQGYDKEFHMLEMLDDTHGFTTKEGSKPENVDKNRYHDILPYDQTRVILHNDNDEEKSDYINANYIRTTWTEESINNCLVTDNTSATLQKKKLKNKPLRKKISDEALRAVKYIRMDKASGNLFHDTIKDKTYIATQGCLPNTKNSFWKMISQHDVRIIVMLTKEVEADGKNCIRYWPQKNEEETYEEFIVESTSETVHKNYTVREISVSDTNACRNIFHYQYTNWPSNRVPRDTDSVIRFLEDINRRMYRISNEKDAPDKNILCVHCSSGTGRTGTFIVLDMLIDKLKLSGFNYELDIFKTSKMAQTQRRRFIGNQNQYKFIYETVHDYLKNKEGIGVRICDN